MKSVFMKGFVLFHMDLSMSLVLFSWEFGVYYKTITLFLFFIKNIFWGGMSTPMLVRVCLCFFVLESNNKPDFWESLLGVSFIFYLSLGDVHSLDNVAQKYFCCFCLCVFFGFLCEKFSQKIFSHQMKHKNWYCAVCLFLYFSKWVHFFTWKSFWFHMNFSKKKFKCFHMKPNGFSLIFGFFIPVECYCIKLQLFSIWNTMFFNYITGIHI